jgi:hypothetical protein
LAEKARLKYLGVDARKTGMGVVRAPSQ